MSTLKHYTLNKGIIGIRLKQAYGPIPLKRNLRTSTLTSITAKPKISVIKPAYFTAISRRNYCWTDPKTIVNPSMTSLKELYASYNPLN